jgi:hypothetical protein
MNPYDDYVSELQMLNRKPAYLRSVAGTIRDFMVSMVHHKCERVT